MNPEDVQYKHTADIYSLTLILHALFGGGTDFYPNCSDFIAIFLAKPKKIAELKLDELPFSLRGFIQRGADILPGNRPSLSEFYHAIMVINEPQPF